MTDSPDSNKLQLGDRVTYSSRFLKDTGQHTGEIPFARGTITGFTPMGSSQLANIIWDREGIPGKVLINNLSRIRDDGVILDRE